MAHHKSLRIVAPILRDPKNKGRTPAAIAADIRAALDGVVMDCVVDDWKHEPYRRAYRRPYIAGHKKTPGRRKIDCGEKNLARFTRIFGIDRAVAWGRARGQDLHIRFAVLFRMPYSAHK
jgi:hypothetical protein